MAYIISDYEEQVMREIDATSRLLELRAINLGGVSGPNGGSGVPPGGLIGQLNQNKVTFDTTESVDPAIPDYGFSLVTNLNRIRAGVALGDGIIQLRHLASGLIIPTESYITVQSDGGTPSYENINTVIFDDSTLTLNDIHTIEVSFREKLLADLVTVGSGFTTRSWFINSALVSGILNPDNPFLLTNGGIVSNVYSYAQYPGDSDLHFALVGSDDGETWSELYSYVHPAGTYLASGINNFVIPSGMFVGVLLGECPAVPNTPFSNVTIILETLENNSNSGGVSLPDFTPARVPYADNTTGQLREDPRFNFLNTDNSSMLVVGADDYTGLGSSTEKVGIDIVREGQDGGLMLETYGSTGGYAPAVIGMRARGTRLAPQGLLTGDILFRFTGRGYAASAWSIAPSFSLKGVANEDWGAFSYGTKAVISVTKNGEATATDVMTVTGDGLDVNGEVVADSADFNAIKMPTGAVDGYVLTSIDADGNAAWRESTGTGGGATAFIDLNDVPNAYTGAGGYKVVVKNDESGLEFVADTPGSQSKYEPDISSGSTAYDDEFNANTLGVKWVPSNTYDDAFDLSQTAGGSLHLSTTYRVGYLTFQGPFGWQSGIYQDFSPVDDNWTLVCKVSAGYCPGQADSMFCMGISGADSDHMIDVRVGHSSVAGIRVTLCDNGYDYNYTEIPFSIEGVVYLMLSKVYNDPDTYYYVHASRDGISWIPVVEGLNSTSLTTATLTRQYFGCYNVSRDGIHSVDFIRYFSNAFQANIGSNP